ncbi:MAG: PHP domain-containing protein [Thermodesulfobacteriota bacterium]
MDLIDLHVHTTASDGSHEPARLVDLAREIGLKALGVTDHDTVDGLDQALVRGRETGFEVVPGIEISSEFSPGTMHMLGYFVDHLQTSFTSRLNELQEARRRRNPQMVEKLNGLGFGLTLAEVEAAAGGGQVGRPHFARVMVAKGYVPDSKEAFDKYLAKGRPAYMDKFRLSPAESIALIAQAGGLAVLAHPLTLKLAPAELENLVAGLKEAGLAGIEVYYSEHTPQMALKYLALAAKFDLAPTGGSDFHGDSKGGISLGRGFGNLAVPYAFLDGLKKRRKAAS